MKTKNYFLGMLAIAALSLASCSSDEPVDSPSQKMEARLELTLTGTPANTRSTGNALPTTSDEETINRVVVAIFNSNGGVNIIQEFTSTANLTVNCTPGTSCTGIVVANAPASHFAGVTTKAAFEAKTVALTQTSTDLPMSGEIKTVANPASTFTLTAGTTTPLSASLSRLVARVAIDNIKTAFDAAGQYSDATFKLEKIFLHNANTVSTVGTGAPTVSVPLSGETDGTNPDLQTAVNPTVSFPSAAHTTPYWFYTFAHDANTPTKLVLYGEFDPDGKGTAKENVYYPVVVNKLQAGTTINDGSNVTSPVSGKGDATITRNSTYLIKATIKGKGVPSPNDDINPAVLTLTVSVANWALNITQNVEFN